MAIPYSRYIVGTLPWYSVLMVSGIFIAYLLGAREEKRIGLPKDSMLDMVLVAIPCGIVGARLYFVLMSLDQFAADPLSVFYIWEGGIAIYGAVIGGVLGVAVQCRIRKRSLLALLDISAPGLALAQAIGRWGNYFNREAYGPAILNPSFQFFPVGVLIGDGNAAVWHVATFFYESMWNLGVFAVLWSIRKRLKRRGDVFLWYLALYGSGRFLVEQLRQDSLYLFGFRVSQYLSLLLCIAVAVIFAVRHIKAHRKDVSASDASPKQTVPMDSPPNRAVLNAQLKPAPAQHQPHARFTTLGILFSSCIPFVRLILPAGTLSTVITFALMLVCGLSLWRSGFTPRFALIWLCADACVFSALLLCRLEWLWHSPYFLYAGLSIAPYLSFVYAGLPNEYPLPQMKEAAYASR